MFEEFGISKHQKNITLLAIKNTFIIFFIGGKCVSK